MDCRGGQCHEGQKAEPIHRESLKHEKIARKKFGGETKTVFPFLASAAPCSPSWFCSSPVVVHAYVLMSNHYHVALETPEANLVQGMAWLQATFANRFHGERGHVFQSRYKSILIEEGRPLLGLVDYIHLNPVRAGLLALPDLGHHTFSRYPKFCTPPPTDCAEPAFWKAWNFRTQSAA